MGSTETLSVKIVDPKTIHTNQQLGEIASREKHFQTLVKTR